MHGLLVYYLAHVAHGIPVVKRRKSNHHMQAPLLCSLGNFNNPLLRRSATLRLVTLWCMLSRRLFVAAPLTVRRLSSCRRLVMPQPVIGISSDSHGNTATITQEPPQALPELCARVHHRLQEFLSNEAKTERLRAVQEQSKSALKILDEALQRYT